MEVDCIECTENGAIVTYKNRNDAEIALAQIIVNKFKNRTTLKYAWYEEKSSSFQIVPNLITTPVLEPKSSDQTEEGREKNSSLTNEHPSEPIDVHMTETSDQKSPVDSSSDQQLASPSSTTNIDSNNLQA